MCSTVQGTAQHQVVVNNNAAMNMGAQASVWYPVFISFWHIPRSGIAVPYGSSTFSFWGLYILFSMVAAPIYIPTRSAQELVPFPPHPPRHFLFLVFVMMAILTSMRWYLIVDLICISLMISNAEHIFMYLLAYHTSSLEKCLFSSSALLKSDCLGFLCVLVLVCLLLSCVT